MAADYYLKLDGITGESTSEGHIGEIELASWSFGVSNAPNIGSATGGAGKGRANIQDINCQAVMSKASGFLFEYCSNGKHFKTAKITCRKSGETLVDFLVIDLEEVYISSYQVGGAAGGDTPYDSFSLAFAKITYDYKAQTATGTTASAGAKSYDLRTNKGA